MSPLRAVVNKVTKQPCFRFKQVTKLHLDSAVPASSRAKSLPVRQVAEYEASARVQPPSASGRRVVVARPLVA